MLGLLAFSLHLVSVQTNCSFSPRLTVNNTHYVTLEVPAPWKNSESERSPVSLGLRQQQVEDPIWEKLPYLMTVVDSWHNLPEEMPGLPLGDAFLVTDVVIQIPPAGILHDNHNFVLVLKYWNTEEQSSFEFNASNHLQYLSCVRDVHYLCNRSFTPITAIQQTNVHWSGETLSDDHLIRREGCWKTRGSAHYQRRRITAGSCHLRNSASDLSTKTCVTKLGISNRETPSPHPRYHVCM